MNISNSTDEDEVFFGIPSKTEWIRNSSITGHTTIQSGKCETQGSHKEHSNVLVGGTEDSSSYSQDNQCSSSIDQDTNSFFSLEENSTASLLTLETSKGSKNLKIKQKSSYSDKNEDGGMNISLDAEEVCLTSSAKFTELSSAAYSDNKMKNRNPVSDVSSEEEVASDNSSTLYSSKSYCSDQSYVEDHGKCCDVQEEYEANKSQEEYQKSENPCHNFSALNIESKNMCASDVFSVPSDSGSAQLEEFHMYVKNEKNCPGSIKYHDPVTQNILKKLVRSWNEDSKQKKQFSNTDDHGVPSSVLSSQKKHHSTNNYPENFISVADKDQQFSSSNIPINCQATFIAQGKDSSNLEFVSQNGSIPKTNILPKNLEDPSSNNISNIPVKKFASVGRTKTKIPQRVSAKNRVIESPVAKYIHEQPPPLVRIIKPKENSNIIEKASKGPSVLPPPPPTKFPSAEKGEDVPVLPPAKYHPKKRMPIQLPETPLSNTKHQKYVSVAIPTITRHIGSRKVVPGLNYLENEESLLEETEEMQNVPFSQVQNVSCNVQEELDVTVIEQHGISRTNTIMPLHH